MVEKKITREIIGEKSFWNDEWKNEKGEISLTKFRDWLNEHIDSVPEKQRDSLEIEIDVWSDNLEINLYHVRLETDQEAHKRQLENIGHENYIRNREYQEYLKLKALFGKDQS